MKRARTATMNDMKKRLAYFTIADHGCIERIKEYRKRMNDKILNDYGGFANWIDYLQEWNIFFRHYFSSGGNVDEMPPSFTSSEPMPFGSIVNEGDAGTGKTFCFNTLMRQMPCGTVSAFAGKATSAFLNLAKDTCIPNGLKYIQDEDTFCKLLNVHFSEQRCRKLLNAVENNAAIQKSYENLSKNRAVQFDRNEARTATRLHLKVFLENAFGLISSCYDSLVSDFKNPKMSLRMMRQLIRCKRHPFYGISEIIPHALDGCDTTMLSLAENCENDDKKEEDEHKPGGDTESELVRISEAAMTASSYHLKAQMVGKLDGKESCSRMPNLAMFSVFLCEEDGMAPSFYSDLRKVLIMLARTIYLPPHMMTDIPIIISSGSTSQSQAIKFPVSCLEHALGPAHLGDREHVLAFQADFFRRGKNEFNDKTFKAYRASCMALETHQQIGSDTYTSLLPLERLPEFVANCVSQPGGIRLYRTHDEVERFTSEAAKFDETHKLFADCYPPPSAKRKLQLNRTSPADIEDMVVLTDVIFIADNIVPTNEPTLFEDVYKTRTKTTTTTVLRDALSPLTAGQADYNARRAWNAKISALYTGQSYAPALPFYADDKALENDVTVSDEASASHEHCLSSSAVKNIMSMFTQNLKNSSNVIVDTDKRSKYEAACSEDAQYRAMTTSCISNNDSSVMMEAIESGVSTVSNEIFSADIQDEIEFSTAAGYSQRKKLVKKNKKLPPTPVTMRTNENVDIDDDKEDVNKDGKKEETTPNLMFMVEKATNVLTQNEHAARRRHALELEQRLGKGKTASSLYLNSARVVDHTGEFKYLPEGDMVVEYALPSMRKLALNNASDLSQRVQARIMYMPFKRTRTLKKNSPVLHNALHSRVVFKGVSCTANDLYNSPLFIHHGPTVFACCVLYELAVDYVVWCVQNVNPLFVKPVCNGLDTVMSAFRRVSDKIGLEKNAIVSSIDRILMTTSAVRLVDTKPQHKQHLTSQKRKEMQQKQTLKDKELKTDLVRILTQICDKDKDFAQSVHVEVYAEDCPLFTKMHRYYEPLNLNKLDLHDFGDIKVVGNGCHPCNLAWLRQRDSDRIVSSMNRNSFPENMAKKERNVHTFGRPHRLHDALWWAVEEWCLETYVECMTTLLLGDVILCATVPSLNNCCRWNKLLEAKTDYKNRTTSHATQFGMMMRRNSPSIKTPGRLLYNFMFGSPRNDLMHLPYGKFSPLSYEGPSDVIVKTPTDVIPYSKEPRHNLSSWGKKASERELKNQNDEDVKLKHVEMLMVYACMNAFSGRRACTIASAQGSTMKRKVLFDMGLVPAKDQLVTLTRADNIRNMTLSSLDEARKRTLESRMNARQREFRREAKQMNIPYQIFRQ